MDWILNTNLTRTLLWSGSANEVIVSGLSNYKTVIVICACGDYSTQIIFYKDIGVTRFVLSSYHSANYNIYGAIDINYSSGRIATSKLVGGWTVAALVIQKVYGMKV